MTSRADRQHQPRISIAMGRRYRGQTQQELATALSNELNEEWSRGMVGHLESGRKELTVAVLMAISKIQDLPYGFYLEGPTTNSVKGGSLSSLQPAFGAIGLTA